MRITRIRILPKLAVALALVALACEQDITEFTQVSYAVGRVSDSSGGAVTQFRVAHEVTADAACGGNSSIADTSTYEHANGHYRKQVNGFVSGCHRLVFLPADPSLNGDTISEIVFGFDGDSVHIDVTLDTRPM